MGQEGIRLMAESAERHSPERFCDDPFLCSRNPHGDLRSVPHGGPGETLLKEPWAIGLAEMMNFPGVIFRDPEVLKKIESAKGKRIDGHAPFLSGKGLNAYLSAGIRSDHECTTPEEAKEKLNSGMWVMIREGTTARNLKDLLPLVTPKEFQALLLRDG